MKNQNRILFQKFAKLIQVSYVKYNYFSFIQSYLNIENLNNNEMKKIIDFMFKVLVFFAKYSLQLYFSFVQDKQTGVKLKCIGD